MEVQVPTWPLLTPQRGQASCCCWVDVECHAPHQTISFTILVGRQKRHLITGLGIEVQDPPQIYSGLNLHCQGGASLFPGRDENQDSLFSLYWWEWGLGSNYLIFSPLLHCPFPGTLARESRLSWGCSYLHHLAFWIAKFSITESKIHGTRRKLREITTVSLLRFQGP